MVDNMIGTVAIVHQIPFTCDLIDTSTDPVTPLDSANSSSFLQMDGKMKNNQICKPQKRFASTLEKVCIFKTTKHKLNKNFSIICNINENTVKNNCQNKKIPFQITVDFYNIYSVNDIC